MTSRTAHLWLGAALLMCPSIARAQSAPLFSAPIVTLGAGQSEVDLDADGRLDLLYTADPLDKKSPLLLRYRRPDGGFDQPIVVPGTRLTTRVGDITGDDLPDFVTLQSGKQISVLPTLGKGAFGSEVVSAGASPILNASLLLGDLDGDGHHDVLNFLDQTLFDGEAHVFLSHSDGSLTLAADIFGLGSPEQTQVADVDADGNGDLLTIRFSSQGDLLSVALGHGDGSFAPFVDTNLGFIGIGFDLRDLDDDGELDAAASTMGQAEALKVKILRGTGTGAFSLVDEHVLLAESSSFYVPPITPAFADLDEDGTEDLVFGTWALPETTAGFWVLHGLGGFNFAPPEFSSVPEPGGRVQLADVDADGHVDILQYMGIVPLVVAWQGTGTLEPVIPEPSRFVPAPGSTNGIAAADLNGDAQADVVATLSTPAGLAVWLGNGSGDLALQPLAATSAPLDQLDVADMDADGDLDAIATAGLIDDALAVGLNDGAAQFAFLPTVSSPSIKRIVVADLGGGPEPDVATSWTSLSQVGVFINVGGGSLGLPMAHVAGGAPAGLAAGDLDLDGAVDLVTALPDLDTVAVLGGAAGFAVVATWPTGNHPEEISVADFDGDGDPDVLVSTTSTFQQYGLDTLLNDGYGGMLSAATVPVSSVHADRMFVADLDRDGVLDATLLGQISQFGAFPNSRMAGLVTGLPAGGFSDPTFHHVPPGAHDIAAADFDSDGFPDLVTSSTGEPPQIGLLRNSAAPWVSLGGFLGGPLGEPLLKGSGLPMPDLKVELSVSGLTQPAVGFVVAGVAAEFAPFKGGVLVPSPGAAQPLHAGGSLTTRWPKGLAPDTPVYLQAWFAAGSDVAASNALVVVAQ